MNYEEQRKKISDTLHAAMYKMTDAEAEMCAGYFARVEMLEENAREMTKAMQIVGANVRELNNIVNILSRQTIAREEGRKVSPDQRTYHAREKKSRRMK